MAIIKKASKIVGIRLWVYESITDITSQQQEPTHTQKPPVTCQVGWRRLQTGRRAAAATPISGVTTYPRAVPII